MYNISLDEFIEKCFKELFPINTFCKSWNYEILLDNIKEIDNGTINRLIVNMPPRSMKSFYFSIVLPAWLLGKNPSANIIVASYSSNLSMKHSIDTRYIINSDWYKEIFPHTIISNDQNTKTKFQTKSHGFRLATSTGSYLTGEGADLIIADDPITPMQIYSLNERNKNINWFESTLMTRLNNFKTGKVIIVMHRLHKDDLTGYLLKKDAKLWNHIKIPFLHTQNKQYKIRTQNKKIRVKKNCTINPKLYLNKDVKKIKSEVGTNIFNTQYQQCPEINTNTLIKFQWFQRFKEAPTQPVEVIYSCDIASSLTGNYSVFMRIEIMNNLYYITNIVRVRYEYTKIKHIVYSICNEIIPNYILIENKSNGIALIQEFYKKTKSTIIKINPYQSKMYRLLECINLIENGHVFIPSKASWLNKFENEISNFPNDKNDDQVDALSQFLNWNNGRNKHYIRNL